MKPTDVAAYQKSFSENVRIVSDDLMDTILTTSLEFGSCDATLAGIIDVITDKPTPHDMIVAEREQWVEFDEDADCPTEDD